ncbi:hypothetical protein [Sphingomonas sp. CFBP 13733]|uniref:hypothetical protein n=1 Tax=Sphingomonas sp. CFBP 13733 TaxID=2775291 RepID=UPI001785AEF8|nr:hypothetical protein [Sphingomonas sp. CFBP 13733]MBD8641902.1 hypothetical protein [Sphingomonas sp. CFBP 13733]
MLTVFDDRDVALAHLPCELNYREIGESNAVDVPAGMCTSLIIWKVGWNKQLDRKDIIGDEVSKDVIGSFFEYWQAGLGIGCHIDSKPRRALVEVRFFG